LTASSTIYKEVEYLWLTLSHYAEGLRFGSASRLLGVLEDKSAQLLRLCEDVQVRLQLDKCRFSVSQPPPPNGGLSTRDSHFAPASHADAPSSPLGTHRLPEVEPAGAPDNGTSPFYWLYVSGFLALDALIIGSALFLKSGKRKMKLN